MNIRNLIDELAEKHILTKEELVYIIKNINDEDRKYLSEKASCLRDKYYGKKVYLRALIEFTNICKNDCYYCGIRKSNKNADRYRLSLEQIMECADIGHKLGYSTYVLQGGEDPYFTDDKIVEIVKSIKAKYPDCAITLSIGEKSYESYRIQCLRNLKEIGYQIGAGFMVHSPYQTPEILAEDLLFLKDLDPHMVGIGPFIPHHDTQFKDEPAGTVEETTLMLSLIRLLLPTCLLPATTALGTIDPIGREKGFDAGANVAMPNLSPTSSRKKYELYDNKICTGDEAAECRYCIEKRINLAGYELDMSRGDNVTWTRK